jgi:hypothetical protein
VNVSFGFAKWSDQMKTKADRIHAACRGALTMAVALVALVASPLSAGADNTQRDKARYETLVRAVNRNVGHAHMARGMNACTILALHDAASAPDIPILQGMLGDEDRVVRLTALYVLPTMGPAGVAALQSKASSLDRVDVEAAINDAAKTIETIDSYRRNGTCKIRR